MFISTISVRLLLRLTLQRWYRFVWRRSVLIWRVSSRWNRGPWTPLRKSWKPQRRTWPWSSMWKRSSHQSWPPSGMPMKISRSNFETLTETWKRQRQNVVILTTKSPIMSQPSTLPRLSTYPEDHMNIKMNYSRSLTPSTEALLTYFASSINTSLIRPWCVAHMRASTLI